MRKKAAVLVRGAEPQSWRIFWRRVRGRRSPLLLLWAGHAGAGDTVLWNSLCRGLGANLWRAPILFHALYPSKKTIYGNIIR